MLSVWKLAEIATDVEVPEGAKAGVGVVIKVGTKVGKMTAVGVSLGTKMAGAVEVAGKVDVGVVAGASQAVNKIEIMNREANFMRNRFPLVLSV